MLNRWHVYEMLKGQMIPTSETIKEVLKMDEKELKEGIIEWLYLRDNSINQDEIIFKLSQNLPKRTVKDNIYHASMGYECYQCMDKGLLIIPMVAENGLTYDYMFQCSCSKGNYYKQLPEIDINNHSNREKLKDLANKNYNEYLRHKNSFISSK